MTTAADVEEGIPYGTRLGQVAGRGGDATAVTFVAEDGAEQTIGWHELDRRSNQVARVLADRGLGVGDSLAVCLRNSIDHLLAGFGGWKVGATVVPVRWDLPEWERNRLLDVLGPAVVVDADHLELIHDSESAPDGSPRSPHPTGGGCAARARQARPR